MFWFIILKRTTKATYFSLYCNAQLKLLIKNFQFKSFKIQLIWKLQLSVLYCIKIFKFFFKAPLPPSLPYRILNDIMGQDYLKKHLQRVKHTNRECLLLRKPGSVPCQIRIYSTYWNQSYLRIIRVSPD